MSRPVPFTDRADAGRRLAAQLPADLGPEAIVLALPRGGVPVAREVADALGLPLEALVVRKIGATGHPEYAVGAIAEGGVTVLDEGAIRAVGMSDAAVAATAAAEHHELDRRVTAYRGAGAPLPDLHGRTVVIVDDGLATGLSDLAAARSARAAGAGRVIIAAPVASAEAVRILQREADDVVCVLVPQDFVAVGAWYREFSAVPDATVRALLHPS